MFVVSPWLRHREQGLISINGTDIINPAAMKYSVYDIDSKENTGRNLEGELQRDRVARKVKLELTFPPMMGADFSSILSLMADEFFEVEYYDYFANSYKVATMYVGDRAGEPYYMQIVGDPSIGIVRDIKLNLIEK